MLRDWFKHPLTGAGFRLGATGDGLHGKTDERQPFTLDLTPEAADTAKSVVTIA